MPPAIQIVASVSTTRSSRALHFAARTLELWHLLSLDAPAVATLWTWFIASASHVRLPAASIAAMFVAVWLLYAADRLLDARLLDARLLDARHLNLEGLPFDLEERHLFHHRHRRAFHIAIAISSITLSILVPTLPSESIHLYLLLAGILFGYFILIHVNGGVVGAPENAHRLPKELAVGLFFSAATFIPTVGRRPDLRLMLFPAAPLFALLLSTNCLFIYAWEHPAPSSRTHPATRLALRFLPRRLASTGLAFSLAGFIASRSYPALQPDCQIALACALAFTSLLLLHSARSRFAPTTLRAAADLCLLTPLLLIPFAGR